MIRHSLDCQIPVWVVRILLVTAFIAVLTPVPGHGKPADSDFAESVSPFIRSYCLDCHSGDRPKAKFDISGFVDESAVRQDFGHWELVLDKVSSGEMPPEDEPQPGPEERQNFIDWTTQFFDRVSRESAGDPGPVLARRLTTVEYDNAIRDLTGVDIRPAADFPVDGANQAGFSNSGEALFMSPGLLRKYLSAARSIADHLLFKPDGIDFAPYPVISDTDRDKYCVLRIVDFYRRQPTELRDYLAAAAWASISGTRGESDGDSVIRKAAQKFQVSPQYLKAVTELLESPTPGFGPVHDLQHKWKSISQSQSPEGLNPDNFTDLAKWISQLRMAARPQFGWIRTRSMHIGSQINVLWRNNQYAATRHDVDPDKALADPMEKLTTIPSGSADKIIYLDEMRRFARVFPDRFLILERGREYLDDGPSENEVKGRFLSAGFHNMMGFYRDDAPLCQLILSEDQRAELDRLWLEFEMIAEIRERQFAGFLWFERAESGYMRSSEFDFIRPEDHMALSEPMIDRLAPVYKSKASSLNATAESLEAIDTYFSEINRQIRHVESARNASDSLQIQSLLNFAARAYRRPLDESERRDLLAFYKSLREESGLSHQDAIRDGLVAILMAPDFNYLWMSQESSTDAGSIMPLTGYELASRLSFFLWSSIPDSQLITAAANGGLQDRDSLLRHVRRMMADPKIDGLARDFFTAWLGVRRFANHNAVDRNRFPQFDDELRQAMADEPVHFFVNMLRLNRPVDELLLSDRTWVNPELAGHYGIPVPADRSPDEWFPVLPGGTGRRGGLLSMPVFLTANSPGLRTSPVKRGHWVVSKLLGEHIPAPPPDVPDLPDDEAGPGERTLAETLVLHRQHPNCAACHQRFDSIGLALENFGPIGEWRLRDLGNRAVDATVTFPDNSQGTGLPGLRNYLGTARDGEFEENFIRQIFAYALGRSLILSDRPTLEQLNHQLQAEGYGMQQVIEAIVLTPQFQFKRTGETAITAAPASPGN